MIGDVRTPPLFPSLRGYRRGWLRGDVLAGLSVWAVLVPEALAYATIAGVSPVVGLYAAPPALLLYAALGTSRVLVVGPMSATAALSAATVAQQATPGSGAFITLTVALALTTGLAALAAGLLRLGFLASFISEPVVKGFIVGLALSIIVGQLPTLAGLPATSGDVAQRLVAFVGDLGDADRTSLAVGLAALAVLVGLRRRAPAVPTALLTVAAGILAVRVGGLDVAVVGRVDPGLPSPALPDASLSDLRTVAPGALGLLLVSFAEGLGAARAFVRGPQAAELRPDRELVAVGAANLGSGAFGGFVVNGSLSKTAVNAASGARSQLSSVVVAVLTAGTLLVLTGVFADLPETILAAIVIAAVLQLVDLRALDGYYRAAAGRSVAPFSLAARPDFVAAITTLAGVLALGTITGLIVGVAVSLLLLVYRASRPHIARLGRAPGSHQYTDMHRHPENVAPPGVAVLRVESPLFFANADLVRAHIRAAGAEPGIHAVVVDAETMPTIDITAAHMLHEVADELEATGVRLVLARDVSRVRDVLRRAGGDPGLARLYPTVAAAVEAVHKPSGAGLG